MPRIMGLKSFTRDDPIFHDESVLRDNYRPDDLIERDKELSNYHSALRPVINGAPPKNIFLYGQTGVGKTLATRLVMKQLLQDQEQYDDLDIEVINLVCKSASSSYQVSVNLVNKFRSPENQIPSTGYPPSRIYQMLWTHLNELDASHVLIVLDEIDSIGDDDDILYELPRANDNNNVHDTLVGVIGISNNFTFRDNLSARVKDSLCDEELHFPPYDANQLGNILATRASKAFLRTELVKTGEGENVESDVLTSDVLPLCAAYAAQESGSARQALRLLYKSGELARERDEELVTEAHVREARKLIEESKVKDELEKLPTQSQLTLYAVMQLEEEGETPAKRKDIYKRYVPAAEAIEADVVTDRTIHDRISQLNLKGFLQHNERNDGIHGGSYYHYELNVRPDVIREALKKQTRLSELME